MKNENKDLQTLLKEKTISAKTMERVNIAKSFIEKKYSMKKTQDEEKKHSKKTTKKPKNLTKKNKTFINKQIKI